MKFAKLIVVCFTLCLVCYVVPASTACASAKYVRVIQDGVPLYTNAEIKKVTCLLEKSYYLTVLEEIDEFYKVEIMQGDRLFPKIVGFVDKSAVEPQKEEPAAPLYPTVSVVVKSSSAGVYFSPLASSQLLVVATNTQNMSYYGKVVDEADCTWYYVYFNGYFGYVKSDDVTDAKIALHPTPLPQPILPPVAPNTPSTPTETPDTSTSTNNTSEVLLIAFAGILSTALTCALFLPKQKENGKSFYSENR